MLGIARFVMLGKVFFQVEVDNLAAGKLKLKRDMNEPTEAVADLGPILG